MYHREDGLLIKRIHDCLEKQANNNLRPKGLTMMQMAVLMVLRESAEKRLSLKELERHFRVAQSTIAGIIMRLEQKGFVEAFGDAGDKRVKLACITAAGEACCEDAVDDMDKTEEMLLRGFSQEERELFHALLTKAAANLK